jgi:hypothetical protein
MSEKKITKISLFALGQQMNENIAQIVAISQLLKGKNIGSVYGMPITSYQESVVFAPQVILRFLEKKEHQLDKDKPLINSDITFRLTNKTSETITPADVDLLAARVKSKFAYPLFVWNKGKKCYTYFDRKKGYQLKLNVPNEAEAKRVIEQVLDLQGHSPEWEFLNLNQAVQELQKYDETPRSKVILNKPRKQVRRRPIGKVTFYRAELHIHGLDQPVVLYPRYIPGALP